jgi:SAM-dependent methyltransferase
MDGWACFTAAGSSVHSGKFDMILQPHHAARLERFLTKIRAEIYPEFPSTLHSDITRKMLEHVCARVRLPENARVLDIGCGQGVALELLRARGFQPTGIGLGAVDLEACRRQGFHVEEMDQSFLDFADGAFDFVWCRHCLEHSILPYFTLSEMHRVLAPAGHLYIEVPAPDTSCAHQANKNHYSVLGKSMWTELIRRTGFHILEVIDLTFTTGAGPDVYWAFICRKTD